MMCFEKHRQLTGRQTRVSPKCVCVPTEEYVVRIPNDCDPKTREIWHKYTSV